MLLKTILIFLLWSSRLTSCLSDSSKQISSFISETTRRYGLELYVYLDRNYTDHYGINSFNTKEIFRYLRAMMKLVNIDVNVKALDQAKTDAYMSENLNQHIIDIKIKRYALNFPHDFFLELTTLSLGGNQTFLNFNGICKQFTSFAIVSTFNKSNASQMAIVISRVLAASIGVDVDSGNTCMANKCIMDSGFLIDEISPVWSEASQRVFQINLQHYFTLCLHNEITMSDDVLGGAFCGNGIVESGEDCDPGRLAIDSTTCCTNQCKFALGAKCASGICCDKSTCKVHPKGTLCRSAMDECDLAEECDGVLESCTSVDIYKINGLSCDNNRGVCYDGRCGSVYSQCLNIFGVDATPALDTCVQYLNTKYDFPYGYWTYTNITYVPPETYNASFSYAKNKNYRCGALQCESASFDTWQTFYYKVSEPSQSCTRTIHTWFPVNFTNLRDPGLVMNGASCGDNQICNDSFCSPKPSIPADCLCTSRGFCDNLKRCHCDQCYSGDSCEISQCASTTVQDEVVSKNIPLIVGLSVGLGIPFLAGVIVAIVVIVKQNSNVKIDVFTADTHPKDTEEYEYIDETFSDYDLVRTDDQPVLDNNTVRTDDQSDQDNNTVRTDDQSDQDNNTVRTYHQSVQDDFVMLADN